MVDYVPLVPGSNGGYPDGDYAPADYTGFAPLPTGSALSFIRERTVNKGVPPTPLFPGETEHGFSTRNIGNINHQLETDPEYSERLQGHTQSVGKDGATEDINSKTVDHWRMHPGDVNLEVGYWDASDGISRTEAPRGGDLIASGPVTGFNVQYSGYAAQLRTPTAGQPGPVSGRIGADYLAAAQAANAEVLYATQLSDAALNGAVFNG